MRVLSIFVFASALFLCGCPKTHDVYLSWTPSLVGTAKTYSLFRSYGSSSFVDYADGISATSFVDYGVASGATYRYRVVAHDVFGRSSPPSNVESAAIP